MHSTLSVSVTSAKSCQNHLEVYEHLHDTMLLRPTVPPSRNTEELQTPRGAEAAKQFSKIVLPRKKMVPKGENEIEQRIKRQDDSVNLYKNSTTTVLSDTKLTTKIPRGRRTFKDRDEKQIEKRNQPKTIKAETKPKPATYNMKLIKHNNACRES